MVPMDVPFADGVCVVDDESPTTSNYPCTRLGPLKTRGFKYVCSGGEA